MHQAIICILNVLAARDIRAEPYGHNEVCCLQVQINPFQTGVLKEEKAPFSSWDLWF